MYGLSEMLMMDCASSFTNQQFKQFIEKNNIQYVTSASYHLSSNGLAKHALQYFKEGISRILSESHNIRLACYLFSYRILPHSITIYLPLKC